MGKGPPGGRRQAGSIADYRTNRGGLSSQIDHGAHGGPAAFQSTYIPCPVAAPMEHRARRLAHISGHVLSSSLSGSALAAAAGAAAAAAVGYCYCSGGTAGEKGASRWAVGLEQRSDLTAAAGSAEGVAAAVARGADLRLYMTTNDDSKKTSGNVRSAAYEETLYFPQTYASTSASSGRFAGLSPHHTSMTHGGSVAKQPVKQFDSHQHDDLLCLCLILQLPCSTFLCSGMTPLAATPISNFGRRITAPRTAQARTRSENLIARSCPARAPTPPATPY
jgi:hypothetical protein